MILHCSICSEIDKNIKNCNCMICNVRFSEAYLDCRGHIIYDKNDKNIKIVCTKCYISNLMD